MVVIARHDYRQLERLRRRQPRRPDPAAASDRLRRSGSGSIALFFGGLAFALAPLLGRGRRRPASRGIVDGRPAGWRTASTPARAAGGPEPVPLDGGPHRRSSASTTGRRWRSSAIVAVVLLVVGVELFARRDLGVTAGLSLPGCPAMILGVRGPTGRAFGDQLPRAIVVGHRPRAHGRAAARRSSARCADQIAERPEPAGDLQHDLPGLRPRRRPAASCSCTSQLLLHRWPASRRPRSSSKWASDETEGRLEDGPGDADVAGPLGDRRRDRRDPRPSSS